MDKQFKIYSINFGAFYTDEEKQINKEKNDVCNQMHDIEAYYKFIIKYKIKEDELTFNEYLEKRKEKGSLNEYYERSKEENKQWESKLRELTDSERKLKKKHKGISENKRAKKKAVNDKNYKELIKEKKQKNTELKEKLKEFKDIRKLRQDSLVNENLINLFDNSFSRTIGIENNVTTLGIICITISHYDVMNQLINDGFTYNDGENTYKYRVLTSSAGQIRKKKIVFIKEDVWNEFSYSIMCGLSWDRINSLGGMNINKFLAYLALQNSATDVLEGFNIDECIVVKDFETTLKDREVEFIEKTSIEKINKKTGEKYTQLIIKDPIVVKKDIAIEHSDGCGLCLTKKKSFQIRLPFIKGLMTYANYKKFCDDTEGSTTKLIDLWGKEWDINEDNIKYIFTKSQFKMSKYYNNIYINEDDEENGIKPFVYGWDVYKACYKTYNCHASYCNEEENKLDFRRGQFNYQYWQSLTDVEDDEIKHFTDGLVDKINDCHTDIKTMLDVFGVNDKNKTMNIEQRILHKYPVLLKDFHFQDSLSSKLAKIKKEAKSGKFKIKSINTFLLPDVYAWMQWMFCGVSDPRGLLEDGEVSCKYFEENDLLLDRSPHLFREHAKRKNITKDNCKDDKKKKLMEEYFCSNGIYTSCHDLITKILMFDVDGDHALVSCDEVLLDIVERNCKDIIPLYYDMGKAGAENISTDNIVNSLKSAFKYGNIGIYSNKVTNLWNVDDFNKNTMNLIKLLTAMNNYSIDSAKTLEMVELADEEKIKYKQLLKEANQQMPYFFQFAKDKDKENVKDKNISTVNRICNEIETNVIDNYKYDFSKLGKFNVRYLVSNKWTSIDINSEKSKLLIDKYEEIDKEKNKLFIKAKNNKQETDKVAPSIYDICRNEFNTYLKDTEMDFNIASDILIKYYFGEKKNTKKTLLINLFGDRILNNLDNNLKDKTFGFCECCGERFDKLNNKAKYCTKCAKEIKREMNKENMKKYRSVVK